MDVLVTVMDVLVTVMDVLVTVMDVLVTVMDVLVTVMDMLRLPHQYTCHWYSIDCVTVSQCGYSRWHTEEGSTE